MALLPPNCSPLAPFLSFQQRCHESVSGPRRSRCPQRPQSLARICSLLACLTRSTEPWWLGSTGTSVGVFTALSQRNLGESSLQELIPQASKNKLIHGDILGREQWRCWHFILKASRMPQCAPGRPGSALHASQACQQCPEAQPLTTSCPRTLVNSGPRHTSPEPLSSVVTRGPLDRGSCKMPVAPLDRERLTTAQAFLSV